MVLPPTLTHPSTQRIGSPMAVPDRSCLGMSGQNFDALRWLEHVIFLQFLSLRDLAGASDLPEMLFVDPTCFILVCRLLSTTMLIVFEDPARLL